jgi:hypothetical protein
MNKKHIKGALVPSNAVTEDTRRCIYHAVTRNSLGGLLKGSKWGRGIIDIHSSTLTPTGSCADALAFISALHNVITADGVAELGLKGMLTIIVETDTEPIMFRAAVKDHKISYQQANLVWGTETTF